MYIATVPNRNSPPAILLRTGYREDGKVKSRTLANLSKWPQHKIETLRLLLQGEELAPLGKIFEIAASQRRVRERAIRATIKSLGLERMIAPAPSRERGFVMNLIVALTLAAERKGGADSLSDILRATGARGDESDRALDWLERRSDGIEKELARRYLDAGGPALFGLSSSSLKGGLRAEHGMLTDVRGRPVSIAVKTDGAGAPMTLLPRLQKMKEDFGVGTIAVVAERGLLSGTRRQELKAGGLDWIAPLKTKAIRKLVDEKILRPELFDQRDLLEFSHPDFPGERLAARRDEQIRGLLARKRRAALAATSRALTRLQASAGKGSVAGIEEIEAKARTIAGERKTAKFFVVDVEAGGFRFRLNEDKAAAEAALDGVTVLRTSLAAESLSAESVVDAYENLGRTKRAFSSMKTAAPRHFFLRMLACCVERHMRRAPKKRRLTA